MKSFLGITGSLLRNTIVGVILGVALAYIIHFALVYFRPTGGKIKYDYAVLCHSVKTKKGSDAPYTTNTFSEVTFKLDHDNFIYKKYFHCKDEVLFLVKPTDY